MVHGVILDLDGTLVDSHLDFAQMRREMDLPPGVPVLEALEAMPPGDAARCRDILQRHERAGAERATLMPGVDHFLEQLEERQLRTAVVTRNSRAMAERMLSRLAHRFDDLLSRDDGPVKPDPWAIYRICEAWGVEPPQVVVIGDFYFDVEAGRRAGARTVLLTRDRDPRQLPGADQADYLLRSFHDAAQLFAWMQEPA
jgi:HAD superfamily hydrolase (TIGR01509 family)